MHSRAANSVHLCIMIKGKKVKIIRLDDYKVVLRDNSYFMVT